jgi:hypothetical protein
MPRPLLEIWRELNRDRNGEPSSLMKQTLASIGRKPSSFAEQALVDVKRGLSSPELRERLRRMQEVRGVAKRVLGKPRPIAPAQPDKPAQPEKHDVGVKRGRKPSLTPKQIEDGIRILRGQPKMSLEAACATLEAAGIKDSRSAVYRLVFVPAYTSW